MSVYFERPNSAAISSMLKLPAVLKFRSMCSGEVTRAGRWLRRTGLDEVPQMLAVPRGQMSMVGPRPLTRSDIGRLGREGAQLDWRFAVRPGITGLSQLLVGRGAGASRRLDRLYLKRQSLTLDVQIIALSFTVKIIGTPAVRRWLRRGRTRHRAMRRRPGGGCEFA
jgi:undecaprenyl phosphate N,N'-diacetylbacillosamine 1-phosphate transferase